MTAAALQEHFARRYQREASEIGIVHLGLGAFHRAHQALYTDEVLERFGGDWAICGVSLKRPDIRDQLQPQQGLYTLLERDGSGDQIRVIGAVREILFALEAPEAVLNRMAAPQTRIVSLTVTEKGYCHDPATGKLNPEHPDIAHDLRDPGSPHSALGLIVEALNRRRQAGGTGLTVLCCDNLPENGHMVQGLILELARLQSPELAEWISQEVTFPCTMVDRIVPATTEADRAAVERLLGGKDASPVIGEPFRQWVIEDRFAAGRPGWNQVGAQMVEDVRPFEHMKLRMLNGTHSTLAYLGFLAGLEFVSDAVSTPEFAGLIRKMMDEEIRPTLNMPAGTDLSAYRDALLERYANPALRHRLYQIAMDGSQKLPQRLLGTLRDRRRSGASSPGIVLAVAGWMRYVTGRSEQQEEFTVQDPLSERFQTLAETSGLCDARGWHPERGPAYVQALLQVHEVFGTDLAADEDFAAAVTEAFQMLLHHGSRDAVRRVSGVKPS